MALKVIGAGLGRTGTLSLKLALEALGLGPCYHMVELFKDPAAPQRWLDAAEGRPVSWDTVFAGYAATVDYPSAAFYEPLAEHYPDAKVILTERDPDQWFDSTQKTIFKDVDIVTQNATDAWARMVRRLVVDAFDGKIHDRKVVTDAFRAHNARVRKVIPPERLLVYEVSQGWEPLCAFLGLPVPAAPFPKVNTAEEFAQDHGRRLDERAKGKPA